MTDFYDGTKLLSLQDINGKKPEIYICTSNRSAGKTTFFSRLIVNKYLKKGEKFCLLYRFNYELDECADKFFKDIKGLFFPDMVMYSKKRASGVFHALYLNDKECGYAVSLNNADQLKKYSHLFCDIENIMFDEFQSETNHYCNNEIRKFISIHTSIARGNGCQSRYVPVYMIGNPVTILNPYYVELGISNRIKSDTHFLKGDGFVFEQGFNESASQAQQISAFNRAFQDNAYVAYSAENNYLDDNYAFIEKPSGNSKYICTLKYKNKNFGVREYAEKGILYIDDKADMSFPLRLSVTTDDHNINYVILKSNDFLIQNLRYFFDHGCFRFKNLECKGVLLKTLSY